jgi:hypothetical protein
LAPRCGRPQPDEEVALELERSAGRAQARGGFAAASAFLQRAVALTGDPRRRVDRALAAAEANLQAGQFDVARSLVSTAETAPLSETERARVERLHGQLAMFSTLGSQAPPLLLKAARRLERVDARLARDTYLDAWRCSRAPVPSSPKARSRRAGIETRSNG